MKMVMAVIPREEADRVLENLIDAGYGATFTESRGGMLRQAQKMVFVAVQASKLADVVKIIRENCRTEVEVSSDTIHDGFVDDGRTPVTTELGGAAVFVWDLERFETY
jgi:uncharacterized protein YaaQ